MHYMQETSSSNIYSGFCQIKKSTGNTIRNGADRLRATYELKAQYWKKASIYVTMVPQDLHAPHNTQKDPGIWPTGEDT